MKLLLEDNFTVRVSNAMDETLSEFSHFYKGIYSVYLNQIVEISFVPSILQTEDNWPPVLPSNIDEPSSEQEARLWTVGLSDYVVTPSSLLAGKTQIIPAIPYPEGGLKADGEESYGIVFYVSPEEFDKFSRELERLSETILSVHDYVRVSEVEKLTFANFIISDVIGSDLFNNKDLDILAG
jgi:hypothetical protein